MKKILAITAISSLVATASWAQDASSNASSSPIELSGYFDFYYQAGPQAHAALTTPAPTSGPRMVEGRSFDRVADQLTLNMIELSAKKKVGKVAYRLDAAFGEMVDVLAGNGPTLGAMGTNSPNPAANEPTRNITQATIAYTAAEGLTITAGKFYSPMGYETTKAKDNLQYSRSLTYNFGVPFWHQGLNVAYEAIPKKFTATAYVVNGWDGRLASQTSRTPALGLAVNATPIDPLVLNLVYLEAPESGAGSGRRSAAEFNATYNFTAQYALAADGVWGTWKSPSGGTDAKWNGITLYGKAQFGVYTLSPRFEIYDDSDSGLTMAVGTAVKQKITAVTISNNFDLGDGFEGRVEYRTDKSDSNVYFKNSDGTATDKQDTYTVALLYSF